MSRKPKKGFWCFVQFHKFHWVMQWETYDGLNAEWDYGYVNYWTGNRKTFSELKNNYDCYGWGYDYDGFTFVVPFFIAYLLVLKGTIRERISEWLYFREWRKRHKEQIEAESFIKE